MISKDMTKKAKNFISKHKDEIKLGAMIFNIETQLDLILMKDEDYLAERKELNEEIDKRIKELKDKHIQRLIDEGKIRIE